MEAADFDRLRPHLEEREVSKGDILIAQGTMVEEVYLPETALLTNAIALADGRSAEAYLIGSDGVGGLLPTLARAPASWEVKVRTAGRVYALPAGILLEGVEKSPTLRAQLWRLANDYQARAIQAMACATLHTATARLAHFMVSSAERSGSDEIRFTQEEIADVLNVQRTTVNASAKELKARGAIRYCRGKVRILDHALLTRLSCECATLRPTGFSGPRQD